ncbi:General alpha-glucoside permease [Cyphellophora attinorum]|uniref:General alpha-glucoside permease n=1 Tax=Cyphellophora attinorum TaxID=1664694 RepID=A0A0N0NNX8_9EURO|nr:General alpha-glucoside permease [Phialophora attinorum]KPI41899.1 General alpha-glucoside permease [Phialophora attinorum]
MATAADFHPSELLELNVFVTHHVEDVRDQHGLASFRQPGPSDAKQSTAVRASSSTSTLPHIGPAAFTASRAEHQMTFRQGMRKYPKAIAWAVGISLAIIMEGYDTALVTSLYAFDTFQKTYGVPDGAGQYQISPKWQASISNGAVVSSIFGLFANGILTDRFGYRKTMGGALLVLGLFLFLPFFAFNIQTLLAGQILCGLPWGVFSTLTTTYAAEVMPLNLRGYVTSNINLCWLLGQLCALGVVRGVGNVQSSWSFRTPFGLQWFWILLLLVITWYAPESPWSLVRRLRPEDARKALHRLANGVPDSEIDNIVAMMEHTEHVEDLAARKLNQHHRVDIELNRESARIEQMSTNARVGGFVAQVPYAACFRGSNLRRTEIACMVFMTQNMSGLPIIGYAPYLFRRLNFSQEHSFDITLGMQGLAILGAFVSLLLLKYVQRRRLLYLIGLACCFVLLSIAGIVSCLPESQATLWTVVSLILLFIFVFDATIGPLTYAIIPELPSNRLRVKTVVLARVAYSVNSIVTNVLIQRMLNPLAFNWRGKACFFCAGMNAVCWVYCWFRLPEIRGLNTHELDVLFEKKASARKFRTFEEMLRKSGYYSVTMTPS